MDMNYCRTRVSQGKLENTGGWRGRTSRSDSLAVKAIVAYNSPPLTKQYNFVTLSRDRKTMSDR